MVSCFPIQLFLPCIIRFLVSGADYYTLQERQAAVADALSATDKLKTGIELQIKKHDRIYE